MRLDCACFFHSFLEPALQLRVSSSYTIEIRTHKQHLAFVLLQTFGKFSYTYVILTQSQQSATLRAVDVIRFFQEAGLMGFNRCFG